jgi:hypothetical protein
MLTYDKCDASLIAALHNGFAGYEFSDGSLSLLIELTVGDIPQAISIFEALCTQHGAQWVQAHAQASSRFLTASGSLRWLQALQATPWVSRLALANQLRPARPEPEKSVQARAVSEAAPKSEGAVLLGVIDHGCPFANKQMLRADGSTRVLCIWDQDTASEIKPTLSFVPIRFGYGAQVNRQRLNALMIHRIAAEDELQAYQTLGYDSLKHPLTHGAHTLSLFAGSWLSRSVLEKANTIAPELNRPLASQNPSAAGDIVFVQLPRRALLSPSSTGMSRCILDGVRFILSQASNATQRVVICIPYGSLSGPHDGTSLIEQALDEIVQQARTDGLDVKLVFSSGNSADKPVYARTAETAAKQPTNKVAESRLFWGIPPHLQANTSLDMWFKHPSKAVELKIVEPGGTSHSMTLSSSSLNAALALTHHGKQVGVLAMVNDAANSQLNVLLQVVPHLAGSTAHTISGRWRIEWRSDPAAPLDAHFYLGWGGRNHGFGQRIFPTRLIAGSADLVIPQQGSILGTACGRETYVVGACSNAPAYQRAPYSGSGKPRGGSKEKASCLAVSEESNTLPGLACIGVRSSFNARVNGTSVSAPLAARMLADSGWLIFGADSARRGTGPVATKPQQASAEENEPPIDVTQLLVWHIGRTKSTN